MEPTCLQKPEWRENEGKGHGEFIVAKGRTDIR